MLKTLVAWLAPFMTTTPASFVTTTSPTNPSFSSIRTTVISPPSLMSRPTCVPRMPIVATGVSRVIASGSVFAT